jgi:chorismate dehydratase
LIDVNTLKIGIVPYTNAIPLEHYLPDFLNSESIIKDVPSRLGTLLANGEIDVALLSVIALNANPKYSYIPSWGIISSGEVRSVRLFSEKPPEELKTIALDTSSLSSVTMLRMLYQHYWKLSPKFVHFTPPIENGLKIADGAMSIGDPTMEFESSLPYQTDIGQVWQDYCQLPFVYAVWITREGISPEEIANPFDRAAEKGLANLDYLSTIPPQNSRHNSQYYYEYFTQSIQYHMGEREKQGLQFFLQKAKEMPTI